jgi:hypothetical protein
MLKCWGDSGCCFELFYIQGRLAAMRSPIHGTVWLSNGSAMVAGQDDRLLPLWPVVSWRHSFRVNVFFYVGLVSCHCISDR